MRRRFGLIGTIAAALAVSACSTHRQPSAAGVSARQHADALLDTGCYRCLEEALTIYDTIAATSSHDAAIASERAFDATVLLAIRDGELGLRAEDHQPAVQSRLSSHTTRRAVLFAAVLDQVPWHVYASSSAERDAVLVRRPGSGESVAALRTELACLPASDLPAQYLRQTINCLSADEVGTDSAVPAPDPHLPLLMRYRAATCGAPDVDALAQLGQADPRFIEVDLPIGDAALNGGALLSAERHHAAALQGFPDMLPAAMQLARVHVMLEEYELSLPEYQQVLDLVADQTDAMLGKARALSALGRPLEAIAILDRIITMGSWLVGDAYYWRAWNRYHMKQLELANDDVAASLRLMSTARVHYLAGSIASARNQWPRAQTEFEAALTLDQTDCDIPLRLPVSLPDASRGLRQRNTSVRQPYVSSRRRRAIRPASMRSGMRRWTTLGAPDLSHAQRLRRTRPAIRKASRGSMLELRQRGLDNQRRRGSGRFKLASGQNGGTVPTHCWRSFANSACAIRRPLARHRRGDWPARG